MGREIVQWIEKGLTFFFNYAKLLVGMTVKVFAKIGDEIKNYAEYLVAESFQVTSRLPAGEIRVVPVNNETEQLMDFYFMEENVIKVLKRKRDNLLETFQGLSLGTSDKKQH